MESDAMTYVYLFSFFSCCGWILECIFRSGKGGRIINPGFLKGPYLPLYGIGAILLAYVSFHLGTSSFLQKIIIYIAITSGLEYLTGLLLDKFLHVRLWDYSHERYAIQNHVCLTFSLYWLVLAFGFEYIFLPASLYIYRVVPQVSYAAVSIAFLITIDWFATVAGIYLSKHQPYDVPELDLWSDFSNIIEPLLKIPQVASLSDFRHHRMTTRLDHCLEVAWVSYTIARRFSLDHVAIVRGAVLHDLFHYEWLTDGPRLHGFRHPRLCLENSKQLLQLSKKEEDIIVKHMWPLTLSPPRYSESWIVCIVDTYCTIKDYLSFHRIWSNQDLSADRETGH